MYSTRLYTLYGPYPALFLVANDDDARRARANRLEFFPRKPNVNSNGARNVASFGKQLRSRQQRTIDNGHVGVGALWFVGFGHVTRLFARDWLRRRFGASTVGRVARLAYDSIRLAVIV